MNIKDSELLSKALDRLREVTPLKTDCGAYCDAACCKDNEEAGSGVWLLEGEDDLQMDWADILETVLPVTRKPVRMLYCRSACRRKERPFLCRLFPLTPYYSQKKQCWSVRMDRRAAALCPLYGYGKTGLDREFVEQAEQAVQLLAVSPKYLSWLKALEQEEAAYRLEL